MCVPVHAQSLTLCDPKGYSPPGSSAHGILKARILGWVIISSTGDLPDPRIEPTSIALAGEFFTIEPAEKPDWPIKELLVARG